MKRFHVHVTVADMQQSVQFYSTLFGEPAVVKPDYAKWMIEDPRLNFAISQRGSHVGGNTGVDHLGIQVDTDAELAALREQMAGGDLPLSEQSDASCCYANSDKWWTVDPQGVPWETYRTLGSIPVYGADSQGAKPEPAAAACCGAAKPARADSKACCP
jgi:catechol 2,3-dioxygenase-like lactoylglutathione lyase family enzyme